MLLVLSVAVLFGFVAGVLAEIKAKGDLASSMLSGVLFAVASGMFFTALSFFVLHLIKIGMVFA